jgi:hypothetical protein
MAPKVRAQLLRKVHNVLNPIVQPVAESNNQSQLPVRPYLVVDSMYSLLITLKHRLLFKVK